MSSRSANTLFIVGGAVAALLVDHGALALPSVELAPVTSPPAPVVVTGTLATPSADRIRASAVLHAARYQEQMGLFRCADAAADAFAAGKLSVPSKSPTADRLRAYASARPGRLDAATRGAFVAVATAPSQLGLEKGVVAPDAQMEAYAALVRDVAASLDAFRDQNVAGSSERDSLSDHAVFAVNELALSASVRGAGGAAFAASRIAGHARDAAALLADPLVTGGASPFEHLAACTKQSVGEVKRLDRRADAVTALVNVLAESEALLTTRGSRRALARKLATSVAAARDWAATKPSAPEAASSGKLVLLCFDAGKVVPCKVTGTP